MLAQTQSMLFEKVWGEPFGSVLIYCDQLDNGDNIMFGGFRENTISPWQFYGCRTDTCGNFIWQIDLGFEYAHDYLTEAMKTSWGTYLIYGFSEGDTLPGFREFAVWQIDSDGTVIFEKYYSSGYENFISDIVETSDSGFTIVGVMDAPSSWNWALSILKIDRYGNEIWRNRIDSCSEYVPRDIEQMSDGSYVVIGRKRISEITFIAKYNSNGQLNWIKYPYGNVSNSPGYPLKIFPYPDTAFSVFYSLSSTTPSGTQMWTELKNYDDDGNYISTRVYSERISFSFCYSSESSIVLATVYDVIYQLNSDSTFTRVASLHPSEDQFCKSILYAVPTSDGGYLGVGAAECGSTSRFYMVKFGPDGRYAADSFLSEITISPNPSIDGNVTVGFDVQTDELVHVSVHAMDGRLVYYDEIFCPASSHTELPIRLDLATANAGTYVLEVRTSGEYRRERIVVGRSKY